MAVSEAKIVEVLMMYVRKALQAVADGNTNYYPYDTSRNTRGVIGLVTVESRVVQVVSYQSETAIRKIKSALVCEGYRVSNPISASVSGHNSWIISIRPK